MHQPMRDLPKSLGGRPGSMTPSLKCGLVMASTKQCRAFCRYRFDDEKVPTKIASPVLKSSERQKGGLLRLDTVDMRDVCLLFYEKFHSNPSFPKLDC